jgi:two-component system heavy metal sensor histidine kinase CusS
VARDPSRAFRILGRGDVVAARGDLPWPAPVRGVVVVHDERGRAWRVLSEELDSSAEHRGRERVRLVVQVAGLEVASGALEERFRRGLVIALVVALLAGGVGAAMLAHLSLAPLRRVAAEVDAVGASSLDRRVATAGLDSELARVASAFNDLLGRLQVAMERQRSFVSRASHALRTPTATILARAEVALRRERPASEYREALADVAVAARESAVLVGQLLVLARLDEGRGARREEVPLEALAVESVRLLRARADEAGIALEVAVPAELSAIGERTALRELLDALLDNALRYTPRGGRVGIRAEPAAGQRVAVVVWDTGPGIPAG